MKKKGTGFIVGGVCSFVAFILYTLAVMKYDVQPIGPKNSKVGFAEINTLVRDTLGIHKIWYDITDYFGIVALLVVATFALVAFVQAIKRKSLLKVDKEIYLLGGFYVVVIAFYVLFEKVIINYRPVLEDGKLEASYPSSHTLLIICVMSSTIVQIKRMMNKSVAKGVIITWLVVVIIATVVGRLICGVHWFTDIVGGVILGLSLIMIYLGLNRKISS